MYGKLRKKTRPEAQHEPKFIQADFSGGLNDDFPASGIASNELALLENLVAFPDGLEGRSGTRLFSNVTLPGSGTVHNLAFHPQTKKFLLHRGAELYISGDANMFSWTQVLKNGQGYRDLITVVGTGVSDPAFRGANGSNTNNGVTYWTLSDSGGTRTLNVYSDAAKTKLVSSGSRVGDGVVVLLAQTLSSVSGTGLSGFATLAYTATANGSFTFTDSLALGLEFNDDSKIFAYKGDFIVCVDSASFVGSYSAEYECAFVYVDASTTKMSLLGGESLYGYGAYAVSDVASEVTATPYGYRYLYTFSRITDTSGNPDTSKNRVTGTLVFEGPSNSALRVAGTNITRDYGEQWLASPISGSAANTLILTSNGGLSTAPVGTNALGHYTHISIYRTLDIGTSYGVNPENGEGNNRELYTWVDDVDVMTKSYSDTKPDANLRASYAAGFGLRTRFWVEMPKSEIGEVAGSFLLSLKRGQTKINYCQLAKPEYMGYYRNDLQFFNMDDGVQEIKKVGDSLIALCSKSTYLIDPSLYSDQGLVESVFVLRGPKKISDTIGVVDYGSIAGMDENSFIAHCSDRSIRAFSGLAWGPDLAANKVSARIEEILVSGSVGAFINGVYLLWYRTIGATNEKCLRFGFGGKAGYGWSVITGADFPFPPVITGAVVINDANSIQRLIVLDDAAGEFHWVETFQNQSLSKTYKDRVLINGSGGTIIFPRFRLREFTGETEAQTCYHAESHVYLRPLGSTFLSGFSMTALGYSNGEFTAVGMIGASTTGGDIQFFDRVRGARIQQEYAFKESGFKVVKTDTDYQVHDTAKVGDGPADTSEASYQGELSANMKHWLTREMDLLNRATGTDYTMTWGTFSSVQQTGSPDGKEYGIQMGGVDGGPYSGVSYLYTALDSTSYSDFTIMFWAKDFSSAPSGKIFEMLGSSSVLAQNQFYAKATNATTLTLGDSAFEGEISITMSDMSSAWTHIVIVRSGTRLLIYQDKALKSSSTIGTSYGNSAKGGSWLTLNPDRDGFALFDFRIYTSVITSSALAFYYDDIITGNGLKTLPTV